MTIVVDTHALIWYLTGSSRLSETVRRLLNRSDSNIAVPIIVLAEIKHLYDRHRVAISCDTVVAKLQSDARCTIHALDLDVLNLLPRGLEMHDGIIVATALLIGQTASDTARVATKDARIVASRLVETIW